MKRVEKQKAEENRSVAFRDTLFLIMPNKLKADVTYKVVQRGDFIYFCRCGGQFYGINPRIAQNTFMTTQELLAHRQSFRLAKKEITHIKINTKVRYWTGNIPNNGSLTITAEKDYKFILHGVNDYPQAQDFFAHTVGCPISVSTDPERKKTEDMNAEYERQDPNKKIRIKKFSGILNTAGLLSGIWLWIFPRPIHVAAIIGILIPLLSIILYTFNAQYVSFDEWKNSRRPNIALAVLLPALTLSMLAMTAFNVRYRLPFWLILIAASLMASGLIFIKNKEFKRHRSLMIYIPIFMFVFFYGAGTATNCLFDYHAPKFHATQTLNKAVREGSKTSEYRLVLKGWGEDKNPVEVSVSENAYHAVDVGEDVWVMSSPGLWGLEYYTLQIPQDNHPGDIA